MKDETKRWLDYAQENLASAKILLDNQLYNPCWQNVQQAVEKMLKALLVESGAKVKKTHSINELGTLLSQMKLDIPMTLDEMDLLDSIYLPSKYPLGSVLADFEPDQIVCRQCISIGERVEAFVAGSLGDDI